MRGATHFRIGNHTTDARHAQAGALPLSARPLNFRFPHPGDPIAVSAGQYAVYVQTARGLRAAKVNTFPKKLPKGSAALLPTANPQSPICDLQWAISNLQSPRPFPNIHPLPCFSPWEARGKLPKRFAPSYLRPFQWRKMPRKKSEKGSATAMYGVVNGRVWRGLRCCRPLHKTRSDFTTPSPVPARLPAFSPSTQLLSSSANFPKRPPSAERCIRLSACNRWRLPCLRSRRVLCNRSAWRSYALWPSHTSPARGTNSSRPCPALCSHSVRGRGARRWKQLA